MTPEHLNREVLSLEPVRSPKPVRSFDMSRQIDFAAIVATAGMRAVTSGSDGTRAFLIDAERDLVATAPGLRLYGVSTRGLPDNSRDEAREVLRRLAYGFHHWAAREVVARYHRDLKRRAREQSGRESMSPTERVLHFLRKENGATIGRLARATGLAQSNVTRTVRLLEKRSQVQCLRDGRNVLVHLVAPAEESVLIPGDVAS